MTSSHKQKARFSSISSPKHVSLPHTRPPHEPITWDALHDGAWTVEERKGLQRGIVAQRVKGAPPRVDAVSMATDAASEAEGLSVGAVGFAEHVVWARVGIAMHACSRMFTVLMPPCR